MRQRESTAASECSRVLADAFASSRRCRSSARNSARLTRLSSEAGTSHTLRSPDAGSHRPPAVGPVYLPNVGGPSVSSPECTSVLPRPSSPPAPHRYGSPCRRPLLAFAAARITPKVSCPKPLFAGTNRFLLGDFRDRFADEIEMAARVVLEFGGALLGNPRGALLQFLTRLVGG